MGRGVSIAKSNGQRVMQMATQARAALQTPPSARNQYYGTSMQDSSRPLRLKRRASTTSASAREEATIKEATRFCASAAGRTFCRGRRYSLSCENNSC